MNRFWGLNSKVYILKTAREDLIKYAGWDKSFNSLEVLDQILREYERKYNEKQE